MKHSKLFSRVISGLLAVLLSVSTFPIIFSVTADAAEFENSQLSVVTEKTSMLAPGVTQDAYTLYDKNGDQVKMFVTTADMSVDTVKLFASYKNMDPTNYGMSKLTEQVAAFNEKAAAGDEYYQGTVVAGINASYYNMITGKPTGTFVMNGVDVTTESEGNAYGYFAVMKDGSVKIGNKNEYSNDKGNIQEAIGIYTMLIVDGEIVAGLNSTTKYPRQTIGITAEGNVILMTADGNQAPKSIGLTIQEQAQVMLDLGCVWAGHLDGGGSCTYASKPEGSNDFVIANSPSDGSERSISNGFIIVSTAVADGTFDSATLSAENEYVTPGSTVSISAKGVDSAGGPAELPENLVWQMADDSLGTVENGVFVSNGKTGEAVIQTTVDGEVVGETTINVVVPDAISFSSSEITVPYGKSVTLEISATYGVKDVATKVSDFEFTFSNEAVGSLDGFTFTACEESAAVTNSDLSVALVYDETVTASTKITLGKGSEVIYDFEDNTNQNIYVNETPGTKYNYVWPEVVQQVVTAENGKVHSGNYALAADINYANALESGYMKTSIYATETRVFENAVRVGAWIYISDEWVSLWARWTLKQVTGYNDDGTPIFGNAVTGNNMDTTAGGTGVVYTFKEPGWHYLYVDTSAYSAVGWSANSAMIQLYISDRDGSAYDYVASENSNIPSRFRMYFDEVTVDYSTAVDDREAPVFSAPTYAVEGMPDAAVLNNQTVTANKVTFGAAVADYTGKTNYTGIDASTVKAYIDGVEVACTYANGIVSVTDAVLDNGKHTVKFAACDKMGNYGYVYGYITVNSEESGSTVKLVPHDATLDRIKLASIYSLDLVATAIEEVQSVNVTIDLDNNSTWQLDYMTVAKGFEASYSIDATENIATITITRTGKNTQTSEAVLVTIPVRVWTLKTDYVYANGTKAGQQAFTLAQYKASLGEFWRMSVIANVDCGILTRVDGTVSTFTGERVFCDTEMWANKANMTSTAEGLEYFNAWDGGHIHTAEAMADKAPLCEETGYTDRTYCSVCDSVVDWGTTVDATDHTYTVVDGVLKCHCGESFSGVFEDGKTYVDGIVIADGWTEEYNYYVDGVKLTGLQLIDGYYYDFGDEGVCLNKARLDGFYYDKTAAKYMHFIAGEMVKGEVVIYPEVYFYNENGYAVSGDIDMMGYTCTFDEKGAFVSSADASVVDAGFSGTNIKYVLLSDGTLMVGGEGVMKDYTANGLYPAWVIQNDATTITSAVIGKDITKIGKFGFYKNAYLRSVSFEEGSSLNTIGWGAFGHCWRLASITIPASVEVLEEYAFYECGALKTFDVEEGSRLTTIKDYAFQHDIGIENAYIPDTVVNLGVGVFIKANSALVLNVVDDSVAMYYAQSNALNYETREGTVYPAYTGTCNATVGWEFYPNGTLCIVGSGAMDNYSDYAQQPWADIRHRIKKIVIGKDITAVGNYAFAYTQNATEIVFEENSALTSIGVLSFFNCPKVVDITLPEAVTSISAYAFAECFALESVYIGQGVSFIYGNAFNNSANAVLSVSNGTYAHEYAIINGVAYTVREFVYVLIASGICGENATWEFFENGELKISGSGAMTNFASHSAQPWADFRHQIKKIVIGKDITAVGNYAFAYVQNVTAIEFEEDSALTSIGVLSFFNCPKVEAITLPETVASISAYAFGDCFALETVYVPQGVSFIYGTAFTGSSKLVLNVAEGTYAHEYAETNGVAFISRDFVYTAIASGDCGENATWEFFENGELKISGSGAMTNFASHSAQPWADFRHQIKKIVIGKDITAVGNYAFAYVQNVTAIEFEEDSALTSIGVLSFFNCPKVEAITLPETVTSISAYAFGDCFALETVYVPQGVSFIYGTAFTGSSKLVLNVAEGTYAHEYAETNGVAFISRDFVYTAIASGDCGENATWEFFENGELKISGSGAMTNFASHSAQPWADFRHQIKKIVIGKDITSVGNYAFAYVQNVTAIEFEEDSALTSIGVLSFFNCPNVSEIVLPESLETIGSYAFGDCYALESVYIPAGISMIYHTAFSNSSKVILNVAEGTFAEEFAMSYGLSYIGR